MAESTSGETGTLYGIGVGPGDPELLTLKAHRLLGEISVIAYPAPMEGRSFTRQIAAPCLDGKGKEEIPIRMPMRADRFPAQEVYDRAGEELGAHLAAGRDVAYLCQGDPFFYGSFMYLYDRICGRFPVEVVPGVSSLMAGSASLGAALASRGDSLAVLPATMDAEALKTRLDLSDAAAIIKLGGHFGKILGLLGEAGLISRSRYIERATLETERALPLEEVDPERVPYFSMILVHKRGQAWNL